MVHYVGIWGMVLPHHKDELNEHSHRSEPWFLWEERGMVDSHYTGQARWILLRVLPRREVQQCCLPCKYPPANDEDSRHITHVTNSIPENCKK